MIDEPTPIPGFPGYFINRQTQVFSTRSGKLKPLCPFLDTNGYFYVTPMCGPKKDRRAQKVAIHILMLTTFVGPRPEGLIHVRHLDGVPTNNAIENLAWGTPAENGADKVRHGTPARGERNAQAKATEAMVREIRARYKPGDGVRKLSKEFGLSKTTMWRIILRQSWSWVE